MALCVIFCGQIQKVICIKKQFSFILTWSKSFRLKLKLTFLITVKRAKISSNRKIISTCVFVTSQQQPTCFSRCRHDRLGSESSRCWLPLRIGRRAAVQSEQLDQDDLSRASARHGGFQVAFR